MIAVLSVATLAAAQEAVQPPSDPARPGRSFRPLFGGTPSPEGSKQALDASISLAAGYDDSLFGSGRGGGGSGFGGYVDPRLGQSGANASASGRISYDRNGDRVRFGASSGHSLFYYPTLDGLRVASHSASASFGAALTRRVEFSVNQSVAYSPYYTPNLFAGMAYQAQPALPGDDAGPQVIRTETDYRAMLRKNLRFYSNASLNARLSQATSLSLYGGYQHTEFTEEDRSYGGYNAGARLSRRMGRYARFRIGYGRSTGNYQWLFDTGERVVQHDVDVGVSYDRPLTPQRRTSFGFGTGSTMYTTPRQTYYRFVADGHFGRQIGRSWTALAEYRRGLRMVEGFREPVYGDTASASIGGYAGTRAQIQFGAAYTNGEAALTGSGAGYESYMGHASVRYGLTEMLALSGQYFYYRYRFGDAFQAWPGMPRHTDRHGVTVGVDIWLPLLR